MIQPVDPLSYLSKSKLIDHLFSSLKIALTYLAHWKQRRMSRMKQVDSSVPLTCTTESWRINNAIAETYFTKYEITKIAFPGYSTLQSSLDSILATKRIFGCNLLRRENSQMTFELFYHGLHTDENIILTKNRHRKNKK